MRNIEKKSHVEKAFESVKKEFERILTCPMCRHPYTLVIDKVNGCWLKWHTECQNCGHKGPVQDYANHYAPNSSNVCLVCGQEIKSRAYLPQNHAPDP